MASSSPSDRSMTQNAPSAREASAWVNSLPGVRTADQFIAVDRRALETMVERILAAMDAHAAARVEEAEQAIASHKANADRWRGIAAAMGYEPKGHLKVRPTAPWLLRRIAHFREEAARALAITEKSDG